MLGRLASEAAHGTTVVLPSPLFRCWARAHPFHWTAIRGQEPGLQSHLLPIGCGQKVGELLLRVHWGR
eukprot:12244460-Prorocentrum_lima.AAC.1